MTMREGTTSPPKCFTKWNLIGLLLFFINIMALSGVSACKETMFITASSTWHTLSYPTKGHPKPNITNLCWVISASHPEPNSIIELHIMNVNLTMPSHQCSTDYLAIFDGESCGNSKYMLEKFCISQDFQIFSSQPQSCLQLRLQSAISWSTFKVKFQKTIADQEPPSSPHIRNTVIYIMSITSYLIFTISLRVLCGKKTCCQKRAAVSNEDTTQHSENATENTDSSDIEQVDRTGRNVPYTISGAMMEYPKPPPYSPPGPPPPYTSTIDLQDYHDDTLPPYEEPNTLNTADRTDVSADNPSANTSSNIPAPQRTDPKTDNHTRF